MKKIIIKGSTKLSGVVQIQGAKNSAMKHIFVPLIAQDEFILKNIPRIGSTIKHLDLMKFQGADIDWIDKNSVKINCRNISTSKKIPEDLFYYTSDANKIIPILVSKFGKCKVEINPERTDRGGDQIGSRKFDEIIPTLKTLGIESKYKSERLIEFRLSSTYPYKYKAPIKSFTLSVLALFSALFKKGTSEISNHITIPEFMDIVNLLIASGARIKLTKNKIFVQGPTKLKGITYTNINDVHDFVTWMSAGLSTNSNLLIEDVDYEKMGLKPLDVVLKKMNVKIDLHQQKIALLPQLEKMKGTKIIAGTYPDFVTEWQVLISPLLTQIKGESKVIETLYANRMQHWNEMRKMGIQFKFFQDPKYPEVESLPRAVKINGNQKLYGAKVDARDVRTGAALVIAGLVAKGDTEIENIEHIERGYENLVGRLRSLGANIKYSH